MFLIKDNKKWFKEQVSDINRDMLLPVRQAKGLKDYVSVLSSRFGHSYTEYYYWVLSSSQLREGGLLVPEENCWSYDRPGDPDSSWDTNYLKAYKKYLCADGRIRYAPDPEIDAATDRENELDSNMWWDNFDKERNADGFFYVDEKECWVNPETGEEICY